MRAGQPLQVAQQVKQAFPVATGIPQHRLAIAGEHAFGLQIGFLEIEADRHVQDVPHRRVGIGGARGLGHVADHRRVGVEQPVAFEDAGDDGRQRLADREGEMRRAEARMRGRPVGDERAAAHDRQRVGVGALEKRLHCLRTARQFHRRAKQAASIRRLLVLRLPIDLDDARHDLGHVLEGPAAERRRAPVGERNLVAAETEFLFEHRPAGHRIPFLLIEFLRSDA